MRSASTSKRGILNPRQVAKRFDLARYAAALDLAFFVERYWIVRWDLRGHEPHLQETLPHPCVNLVLEAGRSAVHGVGTQRFGIALEGQGQVVGVKFRPGAFFPFVNRSVAELTDRRIPLEEAFGPGAAELASLVLSERIAREQIRLLESFLRARLPAHDANVETAVKIVQVVLDCREITKVQDLTQRVQISTRTLQRLFRRYVGVSPKWVIRRLRLHEAAERVASGASIDWARMAQELGYCDQAHFIRDFRAQVGRSPTEYAALCSERQGPALISESLT